MYYLNLKISKLIGKINTFPITSVYDIVNYSIYKLFKFFIINSLRKYKKYMN